MFISKYSYYLFEISHPNKYGVPQLDLCNDDEAKIDKSVEESLSLNQLFIERVIVKLFNHYHCDAKITDRVRSVFMSKLTRMGKAIQILGGKERLKLQNKWKETKWLLELKGDEVIPVAKKRKPDNPVIQSCKKRCHELEKKVNDVSTKLKDVTNQLESLKKSNKRISKVLSMKGSDHQQSQKTTRHTKRWSEYSSQYQKVKRQQFSQDVLTAVSFVEDNNFETSQIEFKNKETGEIICVQHDKAPAIKKEKTPEKGIVEKTLYVKERYNVSNHAYHELAMINSGLPRSYTIMKKAQEIDTKSVISLTPGKILGVQQSILQRLKIAITHLTKVDSTFSRSPNVRVKLTGDGTNISRSMHCVVIAFTLIRDSANPNSPNGNHTVAILNCKEDYEHLAESLVEISEEVRTIKSVTIDDVEYEIEWFLTADMKFLAILAGIEAANARFSCVWCKCASEDRHDTMKTWSIKDTGEGARTIEEIQELSKLPRRKDIEKFGCTRQPLFPSIPIHHIVPDILHLFLRVCDVLINLLILELRRLDGVEKRKQNIF